jgi:hypothetical protein
VVIPSLPTTRERVVRQEGKGLRRHTSGPR